MFASRVHILAKGTVAICGVLFFIIRNDEIGQIPVAINIFRFTLSAFTVQVMFLGVIGFFEIVVAPITKKIIRIGGLE